MLSRAFLTGAFASVLSVFLANSARCQFDPSARLAPEVAIPFEPVYVTFEWQNTTDRGVDIWIPGYLNAPPLRLEVTTTGGAAVLGDHPTEDFGCYHARIAPGERFRADYNLLEYTTLLGEGEYKVALAWNLSYDVRLADISRSGEAIRTMNKGTVKQWAFTLKIVPPTAQDDLEALEAIRKIMSTGETPRWYGEVFHRACGVLFDMETARYRDPALFHSLEADLLSLKPLDPLEWEHTWIPKISSVLYRDRARALLALRLVARRQYSEAEQVVQRVKIPGVVKKTDGWANGMLKKGRPRTTNAGTR